MSISYKHVIFTVSVKQAPRCLSLTAYITVASKVLQKLYLAQRSFRKNLLAKDVGDFLDGDTFSSLDVLRRAARGE